MKQACAKCQHVETPPQPMAPIPEDKPQGDEGQSQNSVFTNTPGFDPDKLHQAILAFRPVSSFIDKLFFSMKCNSTEVIMEAANILVFGLFNIILILLSEYTTASLQTVRGPKSKQLLWISVRQPSIFSRTTHVFPRLSAIPLSLQLTISWTTLFWKQDVCE